MAKMVNFMSCMFQHSKKKKKFPGLKDTIFKQRAHFVQSGKTGVDKSKSKTHHSKTT